MHLRKLVTCFGFLIFALAQQAAALGLGEIRLNSALNQPLDAEIRLLSVGDLSAEQISVSLASAEDFQRVGVPRDHGLTQLRFQVDLNNPAGPIIRVTSRDPIREPYLNFLVEARWTAGRLLREYTILLDLPTFAEDEQPAPVAAPSPRTEPAPREQPVRPSVPDRPATPPPTAEPTRPAAPPGDSYRVVANDTLWEVALRVRPDPGASVQQTMVALQQLNPEAFINNNINLLREGAVLRIPDGAAIRAISNGDAIDRVARQNAEWADYLGIQLDATPRTAAAPQQVTEPRGQVRLTTPAAGDAAEAGRAANGDNAAERAALQSELATAREELDRTNRENIELGARVEDLEEQIETMERLLELSNEELRALQLAAAQREAEAAAAADPTPEPEPEAPRDPLIPLSVDDLVAEPEIEPAEPEMEVAEPEPVVDPEPEVADADPVVEPEPAVEPEPVTAPPVVGPSLLDRVIGSVMDHLMWVLLALAGVLAAVLVVYHRRHLDNAFDEDDFELDALDDEGDQGPFAQDDDDSSDMDHDLSQDQDSFEDYDEPSQPSAEAETGDVVGEAEIYIAYGKYELAEEMLLKGLADEPTSTPILMKLLEVYSETQNAGRFDQHYALLLPMADASLRQRAAELREHIDGAGDFDVSAYPMPDQSSEPLPDDDLDLSSSLDLGDDQALFAEGSDEGGLELSDDGELDLSGEDLTLSDDDLSLGDDDLLGSDSETSESDDTDEDFSFDFDLDDGDLETGDEVAEDVSADDGADNKYDMSFEESDKAQEEEDDGGIDFDFGDSEPAATESDEDAALELDMDLSEDSDDLTLTEETAAAAEPEQPAAAAPATSKKAASDDDFDFDMDTSDLDLAALDQEMESLDSDIGVTKSAAPKPAPADTDRTLTRTPAVEAPAQAPAAKADAQGDADDEMDFLADADEAATKLDLARAYMDMGDSEGAKDILSEVIQEGNDEQRREAQELLDRVDA